MDQVIFYKEGHNLNEQVSKIRLSYSRSYKTHFVLDYHQLGLILHPKFEGLLFYFVHTLDSTERLRLNYLHITFPRLFICLIADESHALDAWKLNVFHFEAIPANGDAILETYRKFLYMTTEHQHELNLNISGETVNIPHNQILYLEAEGNYTNIVLSNGKKLLLTKQLGRFEEMIEKDPKFIRLHRSVIINLRLIRAVGQHAVHFYGTDILLEISSRFKAKLKKYLSGL